MDRSQADGAPFFVWYAPMMPHSPHNPPERFLAPQRATATSIHEARYLAMCAWFDETCGQLLGHIDSKGLRENTIVVYVTDNGWIQDSKGPGYRLDSKQSQYDGGLRTPIMIRWPGKVGASKVQTSVSSIDLAPTILKACGVPVPEAMSGIDLLDDQAVADHGPVMGACYLHDAVDIDRPSASWTYRWVIDGNFKRIVSNPVTVQRGNKPGRGQGPELYRLDKDPFEEQNLNDSQKEVLTRLDGILDRWWKP
jgi:uncharacterized sulfatase